MKHEETIYSAKKVADITRYSLRRIQDYLARDHERTGIDKFFPGATKTESGHWRIPQSAVDHFQSHHNKRFLADGKLYP